MAEIQKIVELSKNVKWLFILTWSSWAKYYSMQENLDKYIKNEIYLKEIYWLIGFNSRTSDSDMAEIPKNVKWLFILTWSSWAKYYSMQENLDKYIKNEIYLKEIYWLIGFNRVWFIHTQG